MNETKYFMIINGVKANMPETRLFSGSGLSENMVLEVIREETRLIRPFQHLEIRIMAETKKEEGE